MGEERKNRNQRISDRLLARTRPCPRIARIQIPQRIAVAIINVAHPATFRAEEPRNSIKRPLRQFWDRFNSKAMMPIMPRCGINDTRFRMSQRVAKSLLAIDVHDTLYGIPNAPRHYVPEKFILIRQRDFGCFPPHHFPSDTLKLAIPRLHIQNAIPEPKEFNAARV